MSGAHLAIPESVARLSELAYNLWWSWQLDARALFKSLDPLLWSQSQHNPVRMLQELSPERLQAVAVDPEFRQHYRRVLAALDRDLVCGETWFGARYPEFRDRPVAYFAAEFALHNSLPLYAGGLGILAGDHCKEASDLRVPMVGVGFMYPQGYFHQRISSEGWQQEVLERLDPVRAPVQPACKPDGGPCTLRLVLGGQVIHVIVWRVQLGRVPLYLMDTDVPENSPADRELSARLYAGDQEVRLRQEILLGIGGVRVLRALGIQPAVWHANEGHAAFMGVERIRELVTGGLSFRQAIDIVRATTAFTTHTPVPAGHDVFPLELIDQDLGDYWKDLGVNGEDFIDLGRHQESWGQAFNMTALALRLSGYKNGVSRRHGRVSREMWRDIWPEVKDPEQVPIGSVTNGVHVATWVGREMTELYTKYLGPGWLQNQDDPATWDQVTDIPDSVLWELHRSLKAELLTFIRERARQPWRAGGVVASQVVASGALLEERPLTLGFARRFATYKRATLLLYDPDRLRRILLDTRRPVQVIFAGKAHPADEGGKRLLQQVYALAGDPGFAGRVAFLEDYDMHAAKFLVRGVDLWLNTPVPPMEASGTSGIKAALNGVPHLSIHDGWWEEGYTGTNGWVIGASAPEEAPDRDARDAASLYQLLEETISPLYYDRDRDGVPHRWVQIMKEAIRTVGPRFSARRMLKEYVEKAYVPAMQARCGNVHAGAVEG